MASSESARDQSRQTGMGAQGRTDDVCAAGVQPFLKQAVGEQVGRDRDAAINASGPIHGFLQARRTRRHKTQVHTAFESASPTVLAVVRKSACAL